MPDQKIEKALYGPSTFEVALGAVLGLVLGVVVACVFLLFKPVQTVKEWPAEPAAGVVYHLPGRTDGAKGRAWQAKQTAFLQGGSIIVNEEELNAWAASLGGGAKPAEGAAAPAEFISASGLNFRLDDTRLHLAQKVLFNYYGLTKEVMLLASGGFERQGDVWAFRPDRVYLGSCPVHTLPGATGALRGALLGRVTVPDEFRSAWAKIAGIGVEGGLLKITTQP